MPHYFIDGETLEEWREIAEEEEGFEFDEAQYPRDENGDFHSYEPAEAIFEPAQLRELPHRVCEVLTEMGATQIRCTYDGGGDEGFAHFGWALIGDEKVEKPALIARLMDGPLAAVSLEGHIWSSSPFSLEETIGFALDILGDALAARLLGEGYGTGDYSLEGAFLANLKTGEILDQRDINEI